MEPRAAPDSPRQPPDRGAIVLVGMMGAGKTAVGRRLARELGWRFVDADQEIEKAAGTSIANIFAEVGEAEFRQSERQVIARLLQDRRPQVLALGGGAFMDPRTRALVRERAVSVWLRADLDVLVKRTSRRNDRPLLKGVDARARLAFLLEQREPVYGEADFAVDSGDGPLKGIVARILEQLPQGGKERA
jgi:shikimate kinase